MNQTAEDPKSKKASTEQSDKDRSRKKMTIYIQKSVFEIIDAANKVGLCNSIEDFAVQAIEQATEELKTRIKNVVQREKRPRGRKPSGANAKEQV